MEDFYVSLGKTLDKRSREIFSASSSVNIEIGYITESLGLKVPRFSNEIPKGEYSISRHLAADDISFTATTTSGGEPSHTHSVYIQRPDGLSALSSGDRVIVAWDNTQPIVVDVIINS